MSRREMGPISQPYEIANSIMMGNNQKGKAALIVEGESDTNVFLRFTNTERCRLFVAKGKKNVLGAIEITQRARYQAVAAVIDADFWHLEHTAPTLSSVFLTDTHDLETMMLRTDAYKRLLSSYGVSSLNSVDIKRDAHDWAAKLLANITVEALKLGYLRWASSKYGLRIKFKEVPIRRCLDAKSSCLQSDRIETEILRASEAAAGSWEEIQIRAEALQDSAHNPWQVCCGHDLTEILSHCLGRLLDRIITRKEIEKQLADSYYLADFADSELYKQLSTWEATQGRQLLYHE